MLVCTTLCSHMPIFGCRLLGFFMHKLLVMSEAKLSLQHARQCFLQGCLIQMKTKLVKQNKKQKKTKKEPDATKKYFSIDIIIRDQTTPRTRLHAARNAAPPAPAHQPTSPSSHSRIGFSHLTTRGTKVHIPSP